MRPGIPAEIAVDYPLFRMPSKIIYRRTGELRFPSPIATISGHTGDSDIFVTRNGRTHLRRRVQQSDPKTRAQLARRAAKAAAAAGWIALTEDAREEWLRFALNEARRRHGASPARNAGCLAYSAAQTYRLGMGLPVGVSGPSGGVPPAITGVEQQPAPDAGSFSFAVHHQADNPTGLRLLFRITPAMPTPRRRPQRGQLRWFAPNDSACFLPLQESGAVYDLTGARFEIAPGQRYGVEVQLVNEDGLRSASGLYDFTKLEPGQLPFVKPETEPHQTSESPAMPHDNREQKSRSVSHIFSMERERTPSPRSSVALRATLLEFAPRATPLAAVIRRIPMRHPGSLLHLRLHLPRSSVALRFDTPILISFHRSEGARVSSRVARSSFRPPRRKNCNAAPGTPAPNPGASKARRDNPGVLGRGAKASSSPFRVSNAMPVNTSSRAPGRKSSSSSAKHSLFSQHVCAVPE